MVQKKMSVIKLGATALAASAAIVAVAPASAADWSDTSIGWRYGSAFREPFNSQDISKNIINLEHVSGYKYGSNFFNVDMLMSDDKDPGALGSKNGAHEVYIVYRHTLDIGKVMGQPIKFGPVRGVGFTAGFDYNTKTDVGYNSKKRMVVAGPTLMFDVPGFLNVTALVLWESNGPSGFDFSSGAPKPFSVERYHYKTHPALDVAWGIPFGAGFEFAGYGDYIASKGNNEFGGKTAAETHIDLKVMYDVGALMGKKGAFKAGVGYEYWKNKFGNDSGGAAGSGAFAKTPMIRAEYHF